jgi:hypothetical protein
MTRNVAARLIAENWKIDVMFVTCRSRWYIRIASSAGQTSHLVRTIVPVIF